MTKDNTERETVLMAIEKKWVDEHGHFHVELFAPANRFEGKGIPEESAILEILPGESDRKSQSDMSHSSG